MTSSLNDDNFSHDVLPERLRRQQRLNNVLSTVSGGSLAAPDANKQEEEGASASSAYTSSRPINLLAKAVAILSRREYSEAELRRRLHQYSEDESQIDAVIARLQRENWQSDQRFAENFVSSRQNKWGNQKILHALKNHHLDVETVAQLKDSLKETEFERALAVWQHKFHGELPKTAQEKAKQMRFLASRGFSADIVRKVLSAKDE